MGSTSTGIPIPRTIRSSPSYFSYVPPGWDTWFAVHSAVYYDYRAAVNGRESQLFGTAPRDYITRVLTRRAIHFIDRPSATKPFFLYFAPTAPHSPATPDPRDRGRFDIQGYVRPPSYGTVEAGAPAYLTNRPWSSRRAKLTNALHRAQLNAAFGVDRAVGQLWKALPANTIVLFMTDNGFMWGQHSWSGKQVPYGPSLRIPMFVVGKALQTPLSGGTDPCPAMDSFTTSCDGRIVLNVDVAPTLEGLAGVTSGHTLEGLDMLTSARQDFVLEHWNGGLAGQPPTFCGVRSLDCMYVRYKRYGSRCGRGSTTRRAIPGRWTTSP